VDKIFFEFDFRITLEQTDAVGIIHNSVVFRIMEVAELEGLRAYNVHWLQFDKLFFPRTNVSAKFLKALRFDDKVKLLVKVLRVRAAKVILRHEFYNESGELAILGEVEFTSVSRDGFTPQMLPNEMHTVLKQFENKRKVV